MFRCTEDCIISEALLYCLQFLGPTTYAHWQHTIIIIIVLIIIFIIDIL